MFVNNVEQCCKVLFKNSQNMFIEFLFKVVLLKSLHVIYPMFKDMHVLNMSQDVMNIVDSEQISFSLCEALRKSFFWKSVQKGQHQGLELSQSMN